MALKLDNSLLEELGLVTLPEPEKQSLLKHIYETLEMRVGMRLADQMSNEQLDEFEQFVNANDDSGAFKWLESNFPNYKDVVNDEFEKLKTEVGQVAPQILSQSQQAIAQGGQPQQPAPAMQPGQPNGQVADPFTGQQPQQPSPQIFQQPQPGQQPQPTYQQQPQQASYPQPSQPQPMQNPGHGYQQTPPAQPFVDPNAPAQQQPGGYQPQQTQPFQAQQPVQPNYPQQQPPAGPGQSDQLPPQYPPQQPVTPPEVA